MCWALTKCEALCEAVYDPQDSPWRSYNRCPHSADQEPETDRGCYLPKNGKRGSWDSDSELFAPRAWALDHCAAPPFSPMLIILLWIQSFCQIFGTVGKFWCVTFDVEELIQGRSFIRMLKQALIILFRGLTAASYFRPALNLFLEGPSFKLRLIDSKWCSS